MTIRQRILKKICDPAYVSEIHLLKKIPPNRKSYHDNSINKLGKSIFRGKELVDMEITLDQNALWPCDGQNRQRTNSSKNLGAKKATFWGFQIGNCNAAPIIMQDGCLVIANKKGDILLLNPHGKTADAIITSGITGRNNLLLTTSGLCVAHDNGLYIFQPQLVWEGATLSSLLVSNNFIYAAEKNNLHIFSHYRDAELIGTSLPFPGILGLAAGQKEIFILCQHFLFCCEENGKDCWRYYVPNNTIGYPVFGQKDVYFLTANRLLAIERIEGKKDWEFSQEGATFISPPAFWQGKVFLLSQEGQVFIKEEAGGPLTNRFSLPSKGRRFSHSPAVDGDGMIYAGDDEGYVYAITPTGNLSWMSRLDAPVKFSPIIGSGTTVAVAGEKLYVFGL